MINDGDNGVARLSHRRASTLRHQSQPPPRRVSRSAPGYPDKPAIGDTCADQVFTKSSTVVLSPDRPDVNIAEGHGRQVVLDIAVLQVGHQQQFRIS
jgi:hypothetical protein